MNSCFTRARHAAAPGIVVTQEMFSPISDFITLLQSNEIRHRFVRYTSDSVIYVKNCLFKQNYCTRA